MKSGKTVKYFICLLAIWGFFRVTAECAYLWNRANSTDTLVALPQDFIIDNNLEDTCLWNFSCFKIDTIENRFYVKRISNNDFEFYRNKQHSYYRFADDTLFRIGYETALGRVLFLQNEPMLTSLDIGDSLQGFFYGEGEYGELLPISIRGYAKTKFCKTGRIRLPEAEIDSVIMLVHQRTTNAETDSETQIYEKTQLWIKPPLCFPIVENTIIQSITKSDTLLFTQTYYYPQTNLKETDIINDSLRIEYIANTPNPIYTNASYLPNPVETTLFITYELTEPAEIYFSLHNSNGFCMYNTPILTEEQGFHQKQINMSAYPRGAYILYVYVNNQIISSPIIKQ